MVRRLAWRAGRGGAWSAGPGFGLDVPVNELPQQPPGCGGCIHMGGEGGRGPSLTQVEGVGEPVA